MFLLKLWDSAVGITTGLRDGGPRGRDSSHSRVKNFLFINVVKTGFGAHPASYPVGIAGSFPGVKRPVREAGHSNPTSPKVKKIWVYSSTPPYVFMA
jgi:hypothetical protein